MPKIAARNTIQIFAGAMELKLRRDDDTKSGWEKERFNNLINLLEEEVEELDQALMDFTACMDDESRTSLMMECADVALCAMMIFSRLHPLTMHNVRGRPVSIIPKSTEDSK
jgi:hypothetical protein